MSLTYKKNIECLGEFDVAVTGGGVAGVAAAVSAARLGKKVLIIEKSIKLGGLATLGLVNFFVPMCNGRGKQIIFGMAEEFLRLSIKHSYNTLPKEFKNGKIPEKILNEYKENGEVPPRYMTSFSAEIFALTLTELCNGLGITLYFDTVVCDVIKDEKGNLSSVVVNNKSGFGYFKAKQFIDASGDADLINFAEIPTMERGNFHTYYGFKITLDSCRKAVEKQNIGMATSWINGGTSNLYGGGHPKEVPLYFGSLGKDVNRYVVDNQLEMLEKVKTFDKNQTDVVTLPGMPQFRTTRCIEGEYVLKEEDAYRHFDNSVGAICDFDRRDFLFEIPYGTMIKKGNGNIIAAGRTVAGEGYAWDVLRVIPPAIITGQAAGIAASHAIDENKPIWDIDIKKLQAELKKQNVVIHFDDDDVPEVSENICEYND